MELGGNYLEATNLIESTFLKQRKSVNLKKTNKQLIQSLENSVTNVSEKKKNSRRGQSFFLAFISESENYIFSKHFTCKLFQTFC